MKTIIGKTSSALIIVALVFALAPVARADIAVKFFGTAQAGELSPEIEQAVEDTGIDIDGFGCFQAPLVDLQTGHQRGIGVDCLNVFDDSGDDAGDGLQIEAKTFFFLPQGLIVNHGCTSVRPTFGGVGDAGTTHITGSIPAGEFGGVPGVQPAICEDAEGIVLATRGFQNMTGQVRLSGAVNLLNAGDGEITFSCIFVMSLESQRKPAGGRPGE